MQEALGQSDLPQEGARITSVRPLRRDPTRSAILVGGRRVEVLDVRSVNELGIQPNMAWTSELAEKVARAAAALRARRDAIRALTAAPRTRKRLVAILARRGHDAQAVESAVASLERVGLVNDRDYAEGYARKLGGGAAGPFIEAKLVERGVEEDIAASIARDVAAGRNEVSDAIDLARSRVRTYEHLEDDGVVGRRLWSWLARRGFSEEACERAVADAMRTRGRRDE